MCSRDWPSQGDAQGPEPASFIVCDTARVVASERSSRVHTFRPSILMLSRDTLGS